MEISQQYSAAPLEVVIALLPQSFAHKSVYFFSVSAFETNFITGL